jgi:hypothetical protein
MQKALYELDTGKKKRSVLPLNWVCCLFPTKILSNATSLNIGPAAHVNELNIVRE